MSFILLLALAACARSQDPPSFIPDVPASERDALVSLYDTCGGPEWKANQPSSWKTPSPVCGWGMVRCDSDENSTHHVSELQMFNCRLTCPAGLPLAMSSLTHMKTFQISMSKLRGGFPTVIESWPNISKIDLEGSRLTGTLPSWLANMHNLTSLNHYATNPDLYGFSGEVPDLSRLTKLMTFQMYGERFNGTAPMWLADVTNAMVSNSEGLKGFTGPCPKPKSLENKTQYSCGGGNSPDPDHYDDRNGDDHHKEYILTLLVMFGIGLLNFAARRYFLRRAWKSVGVGGPSETSYFAVNKQDLTEDIENVA